jgi:hypothetical protein
VSGIETSFEAVNVDAFVVKAEDQIEREGVAALQEEDGDFH